MGWTSLFGRLTRRPKTHTQGLSRHTLDFLAQPLSPDLVGERELGDGRIVKYLEGWAAIEQANRIFGFDGWGAELVGEVDYHPVRLVDAAREEQLVTGMYRATVRVQVKGCLPKTDVGCGFVRAETPEEHETAMKGAVTDATKRALRYYGDQFGNGLYSSRPRMTSVEAPSRTRALPRVDEMKRRVIDLGGRLGRPEGETLAWVQERYESSLDDLSPEQLSDAVRWLADSLNHRNAAARERRNGKASVA